MGTFSEAITRARDAEAAAGRRCGALTVPFDDADDAEAYERLLADETVSPAWIRARLIEAGVEAVPAESTIRRHRNGNCPCRPGTES